MEQDPYPNMTRWVRELMRRCGVEVVVFRDGSSGLLNVPAKYVAIIDQMHIAMMSLAESKGLTLPEFLPEEPKSKRKPRKRP